MCMPSRFILIIYMQNESLFLKELEIKISSNKRAFFDVLEHLNLAQEDLEEELRQLEETDPQVWEELQKEETLAKEKLQMALAQLSDSRSTAAKRRILRGVQPHWMFVR